MKKEFNHDEETEWDARARLGEKPFDQGKEFEWGEIEKKLKKFPDLKCLNGNECQECGPCSIRYCYFTFIKSNCVPLKDYERFHEALKICLGQKAIEIDELEAKLNQAEVWSTEQARIIKEHTDTIAWWVTRAEELEENLREEKKRLERVREWSHRFCLFGAQENLPELNQILTVPKGK